MKVKQLFDDVKDININSILLKYGVKNVDEYLKGNSIEPTTNYDNIDKWCGTLNNYMKEGDYNVNKE